MDIWKEFSENILTHSAAHHLLTVETLVEKRGYARVTDIAKHLNITTGSASTNLKNLKQKGFVEEDENRFLKLSNKGKQLADAVLHRRNILIGFFVDVLGVDPQQAEIDACKTEHLLSKETTSKLGQFTRKYTNS